jgi:hypothetical protein
LRERRSEILGYWSATCKEVARSRHNYRAAAARSRPQMAREN